MPEGGLRMTSPYQSLTETGEQHCSSSIMIIHVQETFHNTSSFRWMAVVTYCQHEQHTMLRYVVLCGGWWGGRGVWVSVRQQSCWWPEVHCSGGGSLSDHSQHPDQDSSTPPSTTSSQLTRWPHILSLHPHTPLRMFRASHYQLPSSQRRTLSSSLLPKHEGKEGLTPAERNPNMI